MTALETLITELLDIASQEDIAATPSSLMFEDYDEDYFTANGIEIDCVEQHGGEGEGDTYYAVYKFIKDDETVYARFNGWYASYNGAEYVDWEFVTPREKTITVYE